MNGPLFSEIHIIRQA